MVKFKLKNEDQNEMIKTTEKKVFLMIQLIPKVRILWSNYLLNYYYDSKELYNL